jgi:hypothetical protein
MGEGTGGARQLPRAWLRDRAAAVGHGAAFFALMLGGLVCESLSPRTSSFSETA